MRTVREFAAVLFDRYAGGLDAVAAEMAGDAFGAGEFEAAALVIMEDAVAVTADEIDELERLSKDPDFGFANKEAANIVIGKRRAALA